MSKLGWMQEQCFRICSAEGVECRCLARAREATKDMKETIVAQDHIEPEVVGGSDDSSKDKKET